MAHPLCWRGQYFFYAIGNTAAICLTRDLPPAQPADILLLGCGDPRSILYTIFCEHKPGSRKLDFTCCDMDPAILARNVLLLTLISDEQPFTTVVWDIFFHMYLDKKALSLLVEQCNKLLGLSEKVESWNASPYGRFIRMSTEHTLAELRRHWSLYASMHDLPHKRKDSIRDSFKKLAKSTLQTSKSNSSPARSAGPLMLQAVPIAFEHFRRYWKTGVTYSDPKQIAAATLLNPTFAYSLAGEGCNLHYRTDPLVPFHSAVAYGNAKRSVTVGDVVNVAKAEFGEWCTAFYDALSSANLNVPVIRLCVGEATALCRALQLSTETGNLKTNVPVAQWKTQLLHFNDLEYTPGGAPTSFDVIDTSNLVDHIGLLNILIAASPLLSTKVLSGVLYTESLLYHGQDATKEFTKQLYADIAVIGLLVGVCPVDYLSGFTTRSNAHELVLNKLSTEKSTSIQFHQVTTWKSPVSGDPADLLVNIHKTPVFDACQLGTFLYDMYHQLFEQEDSSTFFRLQERNLPRAIGSANLVHYVRESFVLLLKLVRDRLSIPRERWLETMDRFLELQAADKSMPMDTLSRQDLSAQLHRHGVHTVPWVKIIPTRLSLFTHWTSVPPIIRIVMTVPRANLAPLEETAESIGTPPLQCDLRSSLTHNMFCSVHVAFGKAILMGPKTNPWVAFKEDPEGWQGSSPLVVSFTMASALLALEPLSAFNVCLSVRSSPGTTPLVSKLGLGLALFSANIADQSSVLVLPEQSLPLKMDYKAPPTHPHATAGIGKVDDVVINLDEQCELVSSLTARVSIDDSESKRAFGAGAIPQITQVSPCVMRLVVGPKQQDVSYPFPVIGSQNKLRLARKSLYIEIVVPVYGPFKSDGMKLNQFPVSQGEHGLGLWNVHYLNLARLPVLDLKSRDLGKWLNSHVSLMMSARERSLRKKHKDDVLMSVKDSLYSIFVRSSGIQQGPPMQLFCLRDEQTNNSDTIFFISDLRFDLASHTMICDGYVLPLTRDFIKRNDRPFTKLIHEGNLVHVPAFNGELQAWKQLLPPLVERCRTSWEHGVNCEYRSQGKIPLSQEMEVGPLCSCGRGKDTEGMMKKALWRPFAPFVTRVALSPLFAVSYLERIVRDPAAHKCFVCRGKRNPKLMACKGCLKVRYCSEACQKKHWKVHKPHCKP